MRPKHRADDNQGPIVETLTSLGFCTVDCSGVGRVIPGFPDLLVARRGVLGLLEVKNKTKLRAEQAIFARRMEAFGVLIPEIRGEDDVLKYAGAKRCA